MNGNQTVSQLNCEYMQSISETEGEYFLCVCMCDFLRHNTVRPLFKRESVKMDKDSVNNSFRLTPIVVTVRQYKCRRF